MREREWKEEVKEGEGEPDDFDLLTKGLQRLVVEILLVEHLHGHVLFPASALVHGAKGTIAQHADLFDLVDANLGRPELAHLLLRRGRGGGARA